MVYWALKIVAQAYASLIFLLVSRYGTDCFLILLENRTPFTPEIIFELLELRQIAHSSVKLTLPSFGIVVKTSILCLLKKFFEDKIGFNTPSHWRFRIVEFRGSFQEQLLRWPQQKYRNTGMVFGWPLRPKQVMTLPIEKIFLPHFNMVILGEQLCWLMFESYLSAWIIFPMFNLSWPVF
jgi:hypothetical protein